MATFVGYNKTEIAPGNSISVDLSALTGGTIAAKDVAQLMVVSGYATGPALINWSLPLGWTQVVGWQRAPVGFGHNIGYFFAVYEKTLDGSETTVTITDTAANGFTCFAAVSVYRGAFPTANASQRAPANDTAGESVVAGPTTDVTATLPTHSHLVGPRPQLLSYVYLDATQGGTDATTPIVRVATDANLTERWTHTSSSQLFFFAWLDEPWATDADYASRAMTTHWTGGSSLTHFAFLGRLYSTSTGGTVVADGDVWGWK